MQALGMSSTPTSQMEDILDEVEQLEQEITNKGEERKDEEAGRVTRRRRRAIGW